MPGKVHRTKNTHIVLLAGGSAQRFGGGVPKQVLKLEGLPVMVHCLRTFIAWPHTHSIVIVARADLIGDVQTMAQAELSRQTDKPTIEVVVGASTRHGSAVAGARAISRLSGSDDLIFFHDGARPFVSLSELDRLHASLLDGTCKVASLVAPLHETIVVGSLPGKMSATAKREQLFAAKTPQGFCAEQLSAFINTKEDPSLTDLLTWSESQGLEARLVESDADNRKLTLAEELPLFEAIARRRGVPSNTDQGG